MTLTLSVFNPISNAAENYTIGIAQTLSREALSALLVSLFGDDQGSNALHKTLEWLITQRALRGRTMDLTGLIHAAILDADGEIANAQILEEMLSSDTVFDYDESM